MQLLATELIAVRSNIGVMQFLLNDCKISEVHQLNMRRIVNTNGISKKN